MTGLVPVPTAIGLGKVMVTGSSPVGSAKLCPSRQVVKPPDFLSGKRGFESHLGYHVSIFSKYA